MATSGAAKVSGRRRLVAGGLGGGLWFGLPYASRGQPRCPAVPVPVPARIMTMPVVVRLGKLVCAHPVEQGFSRGLVPPHGGFAGRSQEVRACQRDSRECDGVRPDETELVSQARHIKTLIHLGC